MMLYNLYKIINEENRINIKMACHRKIPKLKEKNMVQKKKDTNV